MSSTPGSQEPQAANDEYVVVARRYRPQSFEELVGQEQAAQALSNAITSGRIGHAYLFTGARGVGKTSTARIFAKALNCQKGPTPTPCNECDACLSITSGDDVDVLEIDGASNRGIDEIRQLRSNVNIRPSRSRFKIYIIDEVHMLTMPAFNALLKTLEEPPDHVKFIFCTTDPEKMPITVLSRCQRFDFPPVHNAAIVDRLRLIVQTEQVDAEEEALQLLARRAAGSMRDSQSLLEQLLSFCGSSIKQQDVHAMLGTAGDEKLETITKQLVARDAAGALAAVDEAIAGGVDPGQLAEQLVAYFRDVLVAGIGCGEELLLSASASEYESLQSLGKQTGLETLLAIIQIMDQAITRMRQSTQVRTLLEVALVRVCHLEQLDDLKQALAELRGTPQVAGPTAATRATPTEKKNKSPNEVIEKSVELPAEPVEISSGTAEDIWRQALSQIEDITSDYGAAYDSVAISAPNQLVVSFKAGYTLQKEGCERPERKAHIEQVLERLTSRKMRVDFQVLPEVSPPKRAPQVSMRQRMREIEQHPFVKRAAELFGAEVTRLEDARPAATEKPATGVKK